ncbi:MAG: peptidoglycan-binding domain-containing protein [Candidatus Paceibacterota bacterium]
MKKYFIIAVFIFGSFFVSMGSAFATSTTSPTLNISGFTANGVSMTQSGGAYILNTSGSASTHYAIQFSSGSTASENLKAEIVELKLLPASGQTVSLQNYYSVNYPAAYESFFKDVASGNKPFAYIETNGTTAIKVLDGAQKYLANISTDMRIPGNYPVGTYTLTGTIHDTALNPTVVTYILKVVSGQVLGTEKFNFTSLLKEGSQGNEVMELQKFLKTAGYDCGIADGKFGSLTKTATIKFQIANELEADGIVGTLTRAILNK